MREIYNQLRANYMQQYIGHFKDDYKGQNKLSREATKFAVTNTKRVWLDSLCRLGGY